MIVRKFMELAFVCVVILVAFIGVSYAIGPDDSPDPHSDRQIQRKSGDMHVIWSGRTYRSRTIRPGSVGNRTFRGGGLHGGK